MNPLLELQKEGQSVWLDFITRGFMNEGQLRKLVEQDGLCGVTSNPTIFQKAIVDGTAYDEPIRRYLNEGLTAAETFEAIAIEDVQQACDILRPVFDRTKGNDGFVSLEVSPNLAGDAIGTLEEVSRLFKNTNRPNVMIKIPGTQEGLAAIEQALSDEININITLIFSLERYQQVIDAWLAGLKRLADRGGDLSTVSSVASFFVSRVDALVDKQLEKKIEQSNADQKKNFEALLGHAAVANARQAYQIFEKVSVSPVFKALEAKGARLQRPLWASTSTKNPKHRDVYYVEELIGKNTVDTMPLQTIDAFRDHGKVKETITQDPNESARTLERLEQAGIHMEDVSRQLEEEGVRLFSDSYNKLLESISQKREKLKVG